MRSKAAALACLLAALGACSKGRGTAIPDVEDAPELGRAVRKDLPELIPAYGLAAAGGARFVVNIEAEDSPRVREGQPAVVSVVPSTAPVACRVTQVLRSASAETNQSLAWLVPVARNPVAPNDFVTATIEVARRRALTVPKSAVMIRDGKTMVLRAARGVGDKISYEPAAVVTGLAAGGDVEIVSGLKDGDELVVSGGIGLLNPDFKALAGD